MRTAARIALVLTGTAIFLAAMATPGAQAGGILRGDEIRAIVRDTAESLPRQQPAPRPETLPGYAHAELFAALANIGRFLQFSDLPVRAEKRKDRSIRPVIGADAVGIEDFSHSKSSRGALADLSAAADRRCGACASGGNPSVDQGREFAPVVVRFETVINVSVAGLWR